MNGDTGGWYYEIATGAYLKLHFCNVLVADGEQKPPVSLPAYTLPWGVFLTLSQGKGRPQSVS
jgi:hypothetical protein